ncbi:response regulator [Lacrimispora sp. JR3]|uniref:response regulator n=1 Tax=Lacrimispora sinapis TaxID=3111456 RepID=UPI0037481263
MVGTKVVIVDDSPFSIAYIKGILEKHGLEVVGEAGTLDKVKEVVKEKNPQLVTMDMTLPGTDGLECTRAIHEINKDIKVIVISSMMDDEIVKAARANKVSAYVQKPIDEDSLVTAISRVLESDKLYEELMAEHMGSFKDALMDGINKMTKTLVKFEDKSSCDKEFESKGLTIIVGIIGKFSGRMLIDLDMDTAGRLTAAILKKEDNSNDEVIAVMSELTNIISGNACSVLNRKNQAFGLRVAPPTIMHGENVHITTSDFYTTSVHAETVYGEVLINVGFQRSDDHWM